MNFMQSDQARDLYNRVVPILAIVALVFAVVAVGWSWQNSAADHRQDQQRDKDQDAAAAVNRINAVVNCENANESRTASHTLWNFILDLSTRDAPPEQMAYLEQVRAWIGQVYQPHDCTDLSKKYVLPPPPTIPVQ